MRKLAIAFVVLAMQVIGASAAQAQTSATFEWVGGPNANRFVEFTVINGKASDPANGYSGAIQFGYYGSSIQLMTLPQVLGFPNNGLLSCGSAITFDPNVWGTRTDGTPMDGTKSGDTYDVTGVSNCPQYDAGTNLTLTTIITITEHHVIIWRRQCGKYYCKPQPNNIMLGGSGTATVE